MQTNRKKYVQDDKEDQSNLDCVGHRVFAIAVQTVPDGLNTGDNCNKDKDTNQHVIDLMPNALQKRGLFFFTQPIGSVLGQTSGRFGRRQTGRQVFFRLDPQLDQTIFLGLGVERKTHVTLGTRHVRDLLLFTHDDLVGWCIDWAW
jgi:hypothetical protein